MLGRDVKNSVAEGRSKCQQPPASGMEDARISLVDGSRRPEEREVQRPQTTLLELMVEGKRRGGSRNPEVADSRKMLVCFIVAGT